MQNHNQSVAGDRETDNIPIPMSWTVLTIHSNLFSALSLTKNLFYTLLYVIPIPNPVSQVMTFDSKLLTSSKKFVVKRWNGITDTFYLDSTFFLGKLITNFFFPLSLLGMPQERKRSYYPSEMHKERKTEGIETANYTSCHSCDRENQYAGRKGFRNERMDFHHRGENGL